MRCEVTTLRRAYLSSSVLRLPTAQDSNLQIPALQHSISHLLNGPGEGMSARRGQLAARCSRASAADRTSERHDYELTPTSGGRASRSTTKKRALLAGDHTSNNTPSPTVQVTGPAVHFVKISAQRRGSGTSRTASASDRFAQHLPESPLPMYVNSPHSRIWASRYSSSGDNYFICCQTVTTYFRHMSPWLRSTAIVARHR